MHPLHSAVLCGVGQMQVRQPIFLISFGRIKRHHAALTGWRLVEKEEAQQAPASMESVALPQMLVVQKKNLKDKVYPSKTKTNCPNKTNPAAVTAVAGRKGAGVGIVTQSSF